MLKVLHTADWHIGQTFYEYDRTFEHQQFLNWLVDTITAKEIDVLLMSGDVFDVSNPAAASVNMFYKFLVSVTRARPDLQVIITAGNHDAPARLEAPNPFFEFYNIHIVGNVQRKSDGEFDYEKLVIPIKNKEGNIEGWCIAVPYLRPGDYPLAEGADSQYACGIMALYKAAFDYTLSKQQKGQAVIAMGHLHILNAEISAEDKNERAIMGGVEFVPVSAFDKRIAYTALGHIHKAQRIGDRENVRYSGSPLPMSFSELNYKHQVILFDLVNEQAQNIHSLEIPVSVRLMRVPGKPEKLREVLDQLEQLPDTGMHATGPAPYLEVRVELDGPEPSLRHKIETALINKHVRFAKIEVNYPAGNEQGEAVLSFDTLHQMKPITVFNKIYQSRFDCLPPDELIQLFNQVTQEVSIKES